MCKKRGYYNFTKIKSRMFFKRRVFSFQTVFQKVPPFKRLTDYHNEDFYTTGWTLIRITSILKLVLGL